MIDQLLALQMTTYLQNEIDFLPWDSAINNLEYIKEMLGRTGIYGLFEVCNSCSLNSIFHVVLQWCAIRNRRHTGQVRLIRTRLIRCSTLFKVSMKCFPIISCLNALLIRISTYFEGNSVMVNGRGFGHYVTE